ncbi:MULTISPECIES: DUF2631 domain-containing protein [unclassified Blastococcus]
MTEALHSPSTQRVNQPGREEAVVRAGEHPVEHEEPQDWGWHGETGAWGRIGAVVALGFLLLMLAGNEPLISTGHVWVLALTALGALVLFMDWRRRKNSWRSR